MALPPKSNYPDGEVITFTRYMISEQLDFAPIRVSLSRCFALPIKHWVHLLTASIVFGIYTDALRFSEGNSLVFFKSASSRPSDRPRSIRDLVLIGANCQIDPTATVIGPTIIGDGVIVESGASIVASVVGADCVIGQNCSIRLSVIGEKTMFAALGGSAFWSVVSNHCLVNSPLRFSVVGEDAFIGTGVWITDRILREESTVNANVNYGGRSVHVLDNEKVVDSGYWVLGAGYWESIKTRLWTPNLSGTHNTAWYGDLSRRWQNRHCANPCREMNLI